MKITQIEIFTTTIPSKDNGNGHSRSVDLLVTKIHTDENITGISEIPALPPTTRESSEEIFALLKRYIAPRLIGYNPLNREEIWQRMNRISHAGVCPKSAIDLALYDIAGKKFNTPVYNLIGGKRTDKIPLVDVVTKDTPERMAEKAQNFIEEGYVGVRLKVGQPGKTDDLVLKKVRDAIGDDPSIRVDANMAWSVPKAIRKIKQLEKYHLEFVEQPTPWYDINGMAKLTRSVDTPIAAHEALYNMQEVQTLVQTGATDILGVKAYRPIGGITGTIKVLDYAEIMGIPCYLHSAIEGGICTAASVHICASRLVNTGYPNEITGLPGFEHTLVHNPVKIENGYAYLPDGSGFGVELDEEALKKYVTDSAVIS